MLNFGLVPNEETHAVWTLSNSISRLAVYVDEFEAALELFDFSDFLASVNYINRQFGKWKFIAARDGAMTIFHFHRVLILSGEAFRDCPSLRVMVDHARFRSARRNFTKAFPNAARVRHGVAHSAEMQESIDDIAAHAFTGHVEIGRTVKAENVHEFTFTGSLVGRRFHITHEGEIIDYEISEDTLKSLSEIALEFYDGFSAVALP